MDSSEAARPGWIHRVRPILTWAGVGLMVGVAFVVWPRSARPASGVDLFTLVALAFPAAVGAGIGLQLGPARGRATRAQRWRGALWVGGGVAAGAALAGLSGLFAHQPSWSAPEQMWQLGAMGAFFGAIQAAWGRRRAAKLDGR